MVHIKSKQIKWLTVLFFALALVITGGCCPQGSTYEFESPVEIPGLWSLRAARLNHENTVELLAGETESVKVTLETRHQGPAKFSSRIYMVEGKTSGAEQVPMPEGLIAYTKPDDFRICQDKTYSFSVIIKTTPGLTPGEYILRFKSETDIDIKGEGWITVIVK